MLNYVIRNSKWGNLLHIPFTTISAIIDLLGFECFRCFPFYGGFGCYPVTGNLPSAIWPRWSQIGMFRFRLPALLLLARQMEKHIRVSFSFYGHYHYTQLPGFVGFGWLPQLSTVHAPLYSRRASAEIMMGSFYNHFCCGQMEIFSFLQRELPSLTPSALLITST